MCDNYFNRIMRSLSFLVPALILLTPVLAFAQVSDTASTTDDIYAGGPAAPVISVAEQTGSSDWYQLKDLTFTWDLGDDITAVAADLDVVPDHEPQKSYRPPISELTIPAEDLVEGVNYLSVQLRNSEKWGPYSEKVIRIDNNPPKTFDASVTILAAERPAYLLNWQATDEESGVAYYTVQVGNNPTETLTPSEANSGYLLDVQATEQYQVTITAYDRAGNQRTFSTLLIPTIISEGGANVAGLVTSQAASLLVALMSALLVLLLGYLIYERQRYARRLEDLKKEANDIHTQLVKIFTALRTEIHDQIRSITNKKRMTKGEKDAVEGLNKALSVSEMLLDREVKDVKDLIKKK